MGTVKIQSTRLDLSDDVEDECTSISRPTGTGTAVLSSGRRPNVATGSWTPETYAPDTGIAVLDPGKGVGTVEKIAVNAVMAGCVPAHMDVIIAALQELMISGTESVRF